MTKKRNLVLVLCLVLVTAFVSVGGTLAWLTAQTQKVENVFTVGDINITLNETKGTEVEGKENTKSFKMVPGTTIEKDPVVTVKANSEECYLFVEVIKSANFDTFLTYTMADGWIELDGVDNVYYYKETVEMSGTDQLFNVIAGNTVNVKAGVTKDMLTDLNAGTYPTLTFKAYASQAANVGSAAVAWENVKNPTA